MIPAGDSIAYNPADWYASVSPPARFSESASTISLKRAFDIVGAMVGICLFAPIMLFVYLVLMVDGGRPIFAHRRLGLNGREFYCYKFRSMVPNADEVLAEYLASHPAAKAEWDERHKLENDCRITRVGRFIRRKSLDELPQFINVLLGDMSLVGPRPIILSEVRHYSAHIFSYCRCRPGLTGLWQVSGRSDISYADRVRLDEQYVREQGLWMDIVIVFRTIFVVVGGRGAS